MELTAEWLSYEGPGGEVSAYMARPRAARGPLPAVVVIQEIWGVDGHIADVAERVAASGYVALAPDLYSAGGGRPEVLSSERVEAAKAFLNTIPPQRWMEVLGDDERRAQELAKLPEGQGEQVGETIGALFGGAQDMDGHLATLKAAVSFLRTHEACEGRAIGSVGFCLGGGLSALLACSDAGLGAAAVFYGSSPDAERVKDIGCPLRGFYGRDDPRIVGGLPDFEAALAEAGADFELRIYPETPHAFFNDTRPSYRQEAARDAWAHALALFAQQLDPVVTVGAQEAVTS